MVIRMITQFFKREQSLFGTDHNVVIREAKNDAIEAIEILKRVLEFRCDERSNAAVLAQRIIEEIDV